MIRMRYYYADSWIKVQTSRTCAHVLPDAKLCSRIPLETALITNMFPPRVQFSIAQSFTNESSQMSIIQADNVDRSMRTAGDSSAMGMKKQ